MLSAELASGADGVLGLTHDVCSADNAKVYLSYGAHKSRVFKESLLRRLSVSQEYLEAEEAQGAVLASGM